MLVTDEVGYGSTRAGGSLFFTEKNQAADSSGSGPKSSSELCLSIGDETGGSPPLVSEPALRSLVVVTHH
jgi:hypothetical protein